jgi:DNA-binding transcriptional MerR regulator
VSELLSIGEVAERIGLSLRSIRYYEEVGLAIPSARTKGGHRLYSEDDVARLLLIMKMKPLDFSLEEMGAVFRVIDVVRDPASSESAREVARAQLDMYGTLVEERLRWLQERLVVAHDFRRWIQAEVAGQRPDPAPSTVVRQAAFGKPGAAVTAAPEP